MFRWRPVRNCDHLAIAPADLRFNRSLALLGLTTVLITFFGSEATSPAFTPQMCQACTSGMQEVEYKFRGQGPLAFSNWEVEVGLDAYAMGQNLHYNNSQQITRRIFGNRYVRQVDFFFTSIETPFFEDSLLYGQNDMLDGVVTGSAVNFWLPNPIQLDGSLQSTPAFLRFVASRYSDGEGFNISRARVCCSSSSSDATPAIQPMERVQGFLVATNDVVFFRFPGDTQSEFSVALWGSQTSDLDLFIKCGSRPTGTPTDDFQSTSSNDQEMIQIPSGRACSFWYVAVHAFRLGTGAVIPGLFNLVVTKNRPAFRLPTLKFGVTYGPLDSTSQENIRHTVSQATRVVFGATEGSYLISTATIYWNSYCVNESGQFVECATAPFRCVCGDSPSQRCDYCLHYVSHPSIPNALGYTEAVCSTPSSPYPGNSYNFQNYSTPTNHSTGATTIAHEIAHGRFCLDDESSSYPHCGHSLMGGHTYNYADFRTNLCYDSGVDYLCNHGWDGQRLPPPSEADCWNSQPLDYPKWQRYAAKLIPPYAYQPWETADLYTYSDPWFDAENLIGEIVDEY